MMPSQLFTAFWLGYTPSGPGAGPTLAATPSYIDRVVLAFGNLYPGNVTCQGFLQKANSEDSIRSGIAAIRSNAPNTKILLSLIGTPSPPVGWNTGITDPAAFGDWCASLAESWGLDGFDIDNEDVDTFPGQQFVDTVIGMRKAMPDALLTLDTYIFERDQTVIQQLAPYLTGINTIAYFDDYDTMTALVEQYATVIEPGKISIGVKADKVGPVSQGTTVEETAQLSQWNPSSGAKAGMTLWNLSSDIESITGQPDGTWTNTIHENLP
ncbi:glycoside hydrolase family 18 protein [Sphingomonas qomolangmaensis]|uniref:Glycosyl hydrolase family 18 protein n=1 Tax=Sphingomonas qomolangmaensis TaxID=2918765 RepID=A0ABY5LAS3_9SPHN|nr:glycosyl hydrolase family 18 protein [Sphingomonas qomolangmaensis]UUL82982.1 glycosyl hydrolase family 18 protein [Sphingomonas qomolangmaensis]